MDKIQDFLKEIRSRISSPLFSSFIFSWLIINWKVPIALLFYGLAEWQRLEHSTYIQLIQQTVTGWTGIFAPVIAAVLYTVIAPVLKNAIQVLHAYLDSKGMDLSLTVAKGAKISVERYQKLRDDYKAKERDLSKLYSDESGYIKENQRLREVVDELQKKWDEKIRDFDQLVSYSTFKTWNGKWTLKYIDARGNVNSQVVSFQTGSIRLLDNNAIELFKVKGIAYSAESKEVIFHMEDKQNAASPSWFTVLYSPDSTMTIFLYREGDSKIQRMERYIPSVP